MEKSGDGPVVDAGARSRADDAMERVGALMTGASAGAAAEAGDAQA